MSLHRQQQGSSAFTLPEILLALGLIAVALMALVGHMTVLLNASQKGDDTSVASMVAQTHLERLTKQVQLDNPANSRAKIWAYNKADTPWSQPKETVGATDYEVSIFVTDVLSTNGHPLGSGANGTENPKTKLKQLQAVVTWWDPQDRGRPGLGRLELRAARLLKVSYEAP